MCWVDSIRVKLNREHCATNHQVWATSTLQLTTLFQLPVAFSWSVELLIIQQAVKSCKECQFNTLHCWGTNEQSNWMLTFSIVSVVQYDIVVPLTNNNNNNISNTSSANIIFYYTSHTSVKSKSELFNEPINSRVCNVHVCVFWERRKKSFTVTLFG